MILVYTIIFLISFYLIAKVSDDYFVDSIDEISKKLHLSSDVAGATLMAIGSSAPELFISFIAVFKPGEHSDIGMGTIVGSALFNVLAIIGAVAFIRTAKVLWQPLVRDMLFYSISIGLLLWSFMDGVIDLTEASVFLVMYVVYIYAVMKWRKIFPYKDNAIFPEREEEITLQEQKAKKHFPAIIMLPFDKLLELIFPKAKHFYAVFFVSIVIIATLSWALVESAIGVSAILGIPELIVALTVVAIGTSVPDLISSIIVAKEGRGDMAISNAVGSNIFDILIGLGLPWIFIILTTKAVNIAVSSGNLITSTVILLGTVFLILITLFIRKWRISKRFGFLLISIYIAYLVWAIVTM